MKTNEEWRMPKISSGDVLLIEQYGRSINNIDHRSHCFRVVTDKISQLSVALLVRHGGGDERIFLGYSIAKTAIEGLLLLPEDSQYLALSLMYEIHKTAKAQASAMTAHEYKKAFADGKLKKRKLPKQNLVKVWIEQNDQSPAIPA